jgi:hypothetical protein
VRLLINIANKMHACSSFSVCHFIKIGSGQVISLMLEEKVLEIKKNLPTFDINA